MKPESGAVIFVRCPVFGRRDPKDHDGAEVGIGTVLIIVDDDVRSGFLGDAWNWVLCCREDGCLLHVPWGYVDGLSSLKRKHHPSRLYVMK